VVLKDNTYTYVYGLDLISATDSGGNQNYYMYNGQSSVANIVDYGGNEKARYLYDAFGNTRYELELTPNVWLYTGEQQDDGTGF
jgi:YD repeat-containing protein